MKRKIIICVLVIALLGTMVACLVGCKKQVDNYDLVLNNISYIQESIYLGENENYKVKVVGGMRESEFIADGKKTNVKPYMTITLMPRKADGASKTYAYKLSGEKGDATGSMVKNVLGLAFSANVAEGGVNLGVPKTITITTQDQQVQIPLVNALEGNISAVKALEYAYKAVEADLKDSFKDGVFDREVYIKFINDRNNADSPHYWFVSFMKDTNNYISILVNPKDGSIMSVKR